MGFIENIIEKAKQSKQHIVLPEGTEERTLKAADRLTKDQIADITLIGDPSEIKKMAADYGLKNIDNVTILDPQNYSKKQEYKDLLLKLRKAKGMTEEQADKLVLNPLYIASLMLKAGDADGEIAGARNTTGDVLRPALQIIKTEPGTTCVSGTFLMFLKDKTYGDDGVLVFSDCAVMPNPTAEELAQIAISTAHTTRALVGVEPRIAMLSFSTKGSAKHEMVDKVVNATKLAKELDPTLNIDGELQLDAALVPEVANHKAPGSPIAGKANVLIFPTLEVGNIGYKLVERLAGAEAVGPILQGMAAPVNDLSRGCSEDDIYKMVAVTANQAIAIKARAKS